MANASSPAMVIAAAFLPKVLTMLFPLFLDDQTRNIPESLVPIDAGEADWLGPQILDLERVFLLVEAELYSGIKHSLAFLFVSLLGKLHHDGRDVVFARAGPNLAYAHRPIGDQNDRTLAFFVELV